MIELRWKVTAGTPRLEYRQILWRVDAAGAMSVHPVEWGSWVEVPVVQSDFVGVDPDAMGPLPNG